MDHDRPNHQWLDSQRDRMIALVTDWAAINSGTYNVDGQRTMASRLMEGCETLGGDLKLIDLPRHEVIDPRGNLLSLPLGQAISIRKHSGAQLQVFLGIHMDTVYGPDDPFQNVERVDARTLRGPGVSDAKGGLAVMLIALEALERSELAGQIGWEVLINSDEEIGSPGAGPILAECARRNHFGLVFEPALEDGSMVSHRKGSGNFSIVIRGRAAHAGRDFSAGRNAVVTGADVALACAKLNGAIPDVTVNVGKIDGGGPVNVVPDLAIVRVNARVVRPEDQSRVEEAFKRIGVEVAARHEVSIQVTGGFLSPPKVLDDRTRELCDRIETCGRELNIPIQWRGSGGASDGNKLAAAGLPVIDTMGPRGGKLHSPQEFLLVDSLTERAKLCASLLLKLAGGELSWPGVVR
jgi:glutamate carboxypeptidase